MMRRRTLLLLVTCCGLFVPALGAQTLPITDAEGHTTTLAAAQLAAASHVVVDVSEHETAAHFAGVPLSAVLILAGISLGDKLRGPRLADALLVEAADGYKVVFALAEIDPAFAARQIILADTRDGKPLGAKEGPWRIVAPGDKRPARWIRQITAMKIVPVN
jgi:hypothetical protein